ncbi:hypothetical protein [Streptomyces filamentosus]|uniref:hypothetical protein n=1 Tax=Streptomyces filamentosus TaxID=67294 RepID=UPI0033DA2B44
MKKTTTSSTQRRTATRTPARPHAPARAFSDSHGPVSSWSGATCDLYLELFSTPSPRRSKGAST